MSKIIVTKQHLLNHLTYVGRDMLEDQVDRMDQEDQLEPPETTVYGWFKIDESNQEIVTCKITNPIFKKDGELRMPITSGRWFYTFSAARKTACRMLTEKMAWMVEARSKINKQLMAACKDCSIR